MPTTEELRVLIKTEVDASGAKQAAQVVQQLTAQERAAAQVAQTVMQAHVASQRSANNLLQTLLGSQEATLENYRAAVSAIKEVTGRRPTLTARELGIGATTATTAAAGQTAQHAVSVRQLGLAFFGASTAGAIFHHVLQQIVQTVGDSVQAYRDYQRALPGLTTSANNLNDAFLEAQRSGDKLHIALGRITAPAVTAGLKAQASAVDNIADALDRLPSWAEEHNRPPFPQGIPALSNAPPFAPAANQPPLITNAEFARQQARLRALNDMSFTGGPQAAVDSRTAAALQARLDHWEQIDAAATALNDAQNRQIGLQQQSVNLAAQEAQIRLGMLPAAQQLAAAQRDVTEAQIRARQAALPASEALEDLQYEQQRARLIAMNRGAGVEARTAARRQLRALTRAEPGVALAALEAGRPVTLAGRGVERVELEAQLFQITNERALAQIRLAEETNGLLAQIAEQRTQAIQLTINLSGEAFTQEVMNQVVTVFHSGRMAAENAASQQLVAGG